jgi:hypothetical protein
MSSYGNGKEHATTGHESFLQLFRKRVFSQTSSIHHHHPRMSRVGFSIGHEKTHKKRFPPTLDISYQMRYFRHKNL